MNAGAIETNKIPYEGNLPSLQRMVIYEPNAPQSNKEIVKKKYVIFNIK